MEKVKYTFDSLLFNRGIEFSSFEVEESMDHKKTIKSRYNETAEFYDQRYCEIQSLKYKIILDKISIGTEQVILDVGCGTGSLFLFLEDIMCPKYGIDFSIESLKRFQKKTGKKRSIQLICADVDFLPLKKYYFDIIFLITVLQNMPVPTISLKGIKDLCKHNGLIILSVLKKKFHIKQIKHLLDQLQLVPEEIVNSDNCEDIIIIIKNKLK